MNVGAVRKLCTEVSELVLGRFGRAVIVTSGAIAAGRAAIGGAAAGRAAIGGAAATGGSEAVEPAGGLEAQSALQALAAIGQHRLMRVYEDGLAEHGLLGAQVLLSPLDFMDRRQYLRARGTLEHLLALEDPVCVPVVNENDAVADEEIRLGDNDRLAALVAHLLSADLLLLLTDTAGLLTADPRASGDGPAPSLIEDVTAVDADLEALAGGPGSAVGSGGMATKVAAALIASWSGIRAVVAAAERENVVADSLDHAPGIGTVFPARGVRLGARKLWIAFAVAPAGRILVDEGARRALLMDGGSLLPSGVLRVEGDFAEGDAVEIVGPDGVVFAKGLVRMGAGDAPEWIGRRTSELKDGTPGEVVHRDDLVLTAR